MQVFQNSEQRKSQCHIVCMGCLCDASEAVTHTQCGRCSLSMLTIYTHRFQVVMHFSKNSIVELVGAPAELGGGKSETWGHLLIHRLTVKRHVLVPVACHRVTLRMCFPLKWGGSL